MEDLFSLKIIMLMILLRSDFTLSQIIKPGNDTVDDFYSYFMREAPLYPGLYIKNMTMDEISWLDKDLMERAARFYRKNYVGISISHFLGIFEALALKTTASVIISTGNFASSTTAYKRLLKTLYHVQKMCHGGLEIFVPGTEAFESRKIITRRHRSSVSVAENRSTIEIERLIPISHTKEGADIVRAIKGDLNHVKTKDSFVNSYTWDSSTPIGQFDLGVAQFLYIGHIVMTADKFGVYTRFKEDVLAFIHMWAVFGRLLGIEDRFNVALNLPLDLYQKFYDNTIIASFRLMDERMLSLMMNTMNGFQSGLLVPSMGKFKCFVYYYFTYTVKNFLGSNLRQLMDLEDKVCLQLYAMSTGPFNRFGISAFFQRITFDSWFLGEFNRLNLTL